MEIKEAKKILNENGYALKERFENIDEIRVPEWLWVAYETGDTSNLEDEEIVILHIFEKDHKKHHLEANEEPNFYRTNDVTDEGGMCYTVQVFEDKKNENYNHSYNNGYLVESEEKPLFADNERLSNNRWLEEYNFACDKINTFTVGDRQVIDANEARAAFKEMAESIANLEKMIYMRNH